MKVYINKTLNLEAVYDYTHGNFYNIYTLLGSDKTDYIPASFIENSIHWELDKTLQIGEVRINKLEKCINDPNTDSVEFLKYHCNNLIQFIKENHPNVK